MRSSRRPTWKNPNRPISSPTSPPAQTLRNLGGVLGLFRSRPVPSSASQQDNTADKVMGLLIRLRNEARASKNFALADSIRTGLTDIGITLEDRPDSTLWRKA